MDLKKRPTFEELIDYKEPKITYPDRSALFTRESPLMTQFDNIGAMELEDQQRREMRERMKEDMLRRVASTSQFTMQGLRTITAPRSPQIFSMAMHDDTASFFEDAETEIKSNLRERELEEEARLERANVLTRDMLDSVNDESLANKLKERVDEAFRLLRLEHSKSGPPEDDVLIGLDDDLIGLDDDAQLGAVQTGASSSSAVEEAKKVFIEGREKEKGIKSKKVPTEDEKSALLNRVFTIYDKPQLDELDVTVLRRIAKHKGIQISYSGSGYITREELISAIIGADV